MGLKALIREQKILESGAVDAELVLPGEPLIYSIKHRVGQRSHSVQFFRDMKWKSLLKCWFRSQYNTKTPVVILVRFYVSPPSNVNVKAADLKSESVPAVYSFELCEYLLSFLEMLHHVLINSYRQVVKVDAEKYYSSNPRTVFKFMTWSQYVKLQDHYNTHAQSESIGAPGQMEHIQSNSKRDEHNKTSSGGIDGNKRAPAAERPAASHSPLSHPCAAQFSQPQACNTTSAATH